MGGPGSGKKAASRGGSRGGSRRGSRGGSRGGSQIRGRGGATASSIQDQLLYEEEEEQRIMESLSGQENDSDENEMSCEEEVGPDKEDQSTEVQIPKDAVKMPTFEKTKWPLWRQKCWKNWHIIHSMGRLMRNVFIAKTRNITTAVPIPFQISYGI